MKLGLVRAKVVSGATATDLAAAINAFTQAATNQEYLSIQYGFDGATYTALILYAE